MKKIIALNGKDETLAALESNSNLAVEAIRSRSLVIEVAPDGTKVFDTAGEKSLSESYIFNRYPTDSHFCGILLEHVVNAVPTSKLLNTASLHYRRWTEKTAQMSRLHDAGIPVPHSFVVHTKDVENHLDTIAKKISYPIVCKIDGIQGTRVLIANTETEILDFLQGFSSDEICLLQKFIPNSYDIRVIVAGGKVTGAIKRIAQEGSLYNNVAQGATVELHEPTDREAELAIASATVNKFDLAGVDIIYEGGEPLILEVNMGPGVTGFESVHGEGAVMKSFIENIT